MAQNAEPVRAAKPRATGLPTTPVFGLTLAQLLPIANRLAPDGAVACFDVTSVSPAWPHYGLRGDKSLAYFRYVTVSGQTGQARVFVKRQCHPAPGEDRPLEARHYATLTDLGAPLPRCYGAVTDDQGREVLFLEWLDDVVVEGEPYARFSSDPDRILPYLGAAARLNAIRPKPDYETALRRAVVRRVACPWDWKPRMAEAAATVGRLGQAADEGRLGTALRCLCTPANLGRLLILAGHIARKAGDLPEGLIHGDLEPFQSGYRADGTAVLFDLETVGIGPRFYDVAPCLGAPDVYQRRCRTREELSRHYLACLAQAGGPTVPLEAFLRETGMLWRGWTLCWLGYWLDLALDDRPGARELLYRKVDTLTWFV